MQWYCQLSAMCQNTHMGKHATYGEKFIHCMYEGKRNKKHLDRNSPLLSHKLSATSNQICKRAKAIFLLPSAQFYAPLNLQKKPLMY